MQVVTPERVETVTPEAPPVEVVIPETPLEAQVLELAADILETEGWARGNYSAWGNRCAVGGIGAAMKRMVFPYGKKAKTRREAEKALAMLVIESNPDMPAERHDQTIIRWNDGRARGKTHVVRMMREAAARLTPKL